MTLMRYEPRYRPLSLVDRLHNDLDHLFSVGIPAEQESVTDWLPPVDIREEEDRFVLHADVPGVDPENIEISMEDGVLTVQGERHSEQREKKEGYSRVERVSGRFHRRFSLPDAADSEAVTATNRNGVLEVVIPKQAKSKPRRVSVKVR